MPMPPEEAVECMTTIGQIQAEIEGYESTIEEARHTAKIARANLREARARLGRYIANSTRELPLFDRADEPVDVNEELAAGVAEVEARRAAATISVNGSKPVDLDKFESHLKAAAALESDPDFQRGEAEGEAWHKAKHAGDEPKPKRGRRKPAGPAEARP